MAPGADEAGTPSTAPVAEGPEAGPEAGGDVNSTTPSGPRRGLMILGAAVGVALIEVELIIGVALGAAAMLSPQIRKLFRAEEAEATN